MNERTRSRLKLAYTAGTLASALVGTVIALRKPAVVKAAADLGATAVRNYKADHWSVRPFVRHLANGTEVLVKGHERYRRRGK